MRQSEINITLEFQVILMTISWDLRTETTIFWDSIANEFAEISATAAALAPPYLDVQ
jgi:hypothetical protein